MVITIIEAKEKTINSGISILRLLASYGVVLCHFCDMEMHSFGDFFRRLAVPCFTIIAFYLLAVKWKNISLRGIRDRLWRLFVPMAAWGGYTICGICLRVKASPFLI